MMTCTRPNTEINKSIHSSKLLSLFLGLPSDLLIEISDFLDIKNNSMMTKVSKSSQAFFHEITVTKVRVQQLLSAVVCGNQANAESIIKENPKLLTLQGSVTDYSGVVSIGTAYQIALGDKDARYSLSETCMKEMIQSYLDKHFGEYEIQKQYQARFPFGWEIQQKIRIDADLEAFFAIFTAVQTATQEIVKKTDALENKIQVILRGPITDHQGTLKNMTTTLYQTQPRQAFNRLWQTFENYLKTHALVEEGLLDLSLLKKLYKFRQYLQPKEKIKIGFKFNDELLEMAYKLGHDHFNNFGSWNNPKNKFFWCKTIGYIQRYLPAGSAQVLSQDLAEMIERKTKFFRSLQLLGGEPVCYYPLDASIQLRLGYDFAVFPKAQCDELGRYVLSTTPPSPESHSYRFFQDYSSKKTNEILSMKLHPENQLLNRS